MAAMRAHRLRQLRRGSGLRRQLRGERHCIRALRLACCAPCFVLGLHEHQFIVQCDNIAAVRTGRVLQLHHGACPRRQLRCEARCDCALRLARSALYSARLMRRPQFTVQRNDAASVRVDELLELSRNALQRFQFRRNPCRVCTLHVHCIESSMVLLARRLR